MSKNVTKEEKLKQKEEKISMFQAVCVLFEGISELLGIEERITQKDTQFQKIEQEKIRGVVAITAHNTGLYFRLYRDIPISTIEESETRPILSIWAIERPCGTYTDKKYLVSQKLSCKLESDLEDPLSNTAIFILGKLRLIVQNNLYQPGIKFWTSS